MRETLFYSNLKNYLLIFFLSIFVFSCDTNYLVDIEECESNLSETPLHTKSAVWSEWSVYKKVEEVLINVGISGDVYRESILVDDLGLDDFDLNNFVFALQVEFHHLNSAGFDIKKMKSVNDVVMFIYRELRPYTETKVYNKSFTIPCDYTLPPGVSYEGYMGFTEIVEYENKYSDKKISTIQYAQNQNFSIGFYEGGNGYENYVEIFSIYSNVEGWGGTLITTIIKGGKEIKRIEQTLTYKINEFGQGKVSISKGITYPNKPGNSGNSELQLIEEIVDNIIVENYYIDPALLDQGYLLWEHLHFEQELKPKEEGMVTAEHNISFLEVIMEIEREFDIEINDADQAYIKEHPLSDLIRYIEEKITKTKT